MFVPDGAEPSLPKLPLFPFLFFYFNFFLLFFSVFRVLFERNFNFSESESPGRSALETGSKWEEESLIEFVGEQVSFGKPEAEFEPRTREGSEHCCGRRVGPRSLLKSHKLQL